MVVAYMNEWTEIYQNSTSNVSILNFSLYFILFKQIFTALSGIAQWIERRPPRQGVAGSIPSLGHMPGLWARSPVGGGCERQPYINVSLPLFLFLPLL